MKCFWYSCESGYDGPYTTAKEAREAAQGVAALNERIEIHQLVDVSDPPVRTWAKR